MINKIKKEIEKLERDISVFEKQMATNDVDYVLKVLNERIKTITKDYLNANSPELQNQLRMDLIKNYNLIYLYQAKQRGIRTAYVLKSDIEQLPNVYLIEQKPERFQINESLLTDIDVSKGLTMDQALELLKCTVNNTRDNLMLEEKWRTGMPGDVYGNSCLDGACGLSQFSTLYPLQQLGLEVTINNIGDMCGVRHAYGTVLMPIQNGDKIIKKRFLIDCTYRQFFTVPFNVPIRYLDHSPFPGFFVALDEGYSRFAQELLKTGFVEASVENLENYLKPFYYSSLLIDKLPSVNDHFEINVPEILEQTHGEFDYTEEEFVEWGMNLTLIPHNKKSR